VSPGLGLTEAEEFLSRVKDDMVLEGGLVGAVEHWANLHRNVTQTPPLLHLYEAVSFGTLYDKAWEEVSDSLGYVEYEAPATVQRFRRVFWDYAKRFDKLKTERGREMAASLRLYALLPRRSVRCGDARFFPAAALPAKGWIVRMVHEVKPPTKSVSKALFTRAGEHGGIVVSECMRCLVVYYMLTSSMQLEMLLDKYSMLWQQGYNTGNVANFARFDLSAKPLHNILYRFWRAEHLGCPNERLTQVRFPS
jgi:hypothetical protein